MAEEGRDSGELVRRARAGDGGAWTELVERYSALLWSIARGHGLRDADCGDVVQITWLRLVERLDALDAPAAVGGWLATTARRESLRQARLGDREAPGPAPDAAGASSAAPVEQVVAGRERLCRVGAALQDLPRRCQHLLRLVALAPGQAELAAALDMPVGSLGPTRVRCLAHLRRRLAP
ncbi:RNA polymerase sigma factor [Actinomadura parmotrematis]|uniref:RNA polymerase sigma factor n=1 Tax=Actinomadura parmotrematis TaxID=2864039 RepID=UPI00215D89F7|nr:sigma-70 family RNA polymerase sigma factor [Actinomadura parmotrematis]